MAKKNQKVSNVVTEEIVEATAEVAVEVVEPTVEETVEVVEAAVEETVAAETVTEVLVTPGKNGVSNTQLIPALKVAMDNNDIELVHKMIEAFPAVYQKSYKYFGKKYKNILDANGHAI